MRTIVPDKAMELSEVERVRATALTAKIVGGLHDVIGGFRCAGTGRLVKLGISMTHMHVLWLLQHHGDLSMSRMADLLDVSLSNATGIVDRMEERQLVERVRVPGDRRIVLVRMAVGGLRALDEIEALRQDHLQAILGHLGNRQLARLAQSFDDIRGAIAAEGGVDHEHGTHVHPAPSSGRD
jgi:MarR family transcriptional regulator, organic hydroperoxide resistance regulator